MGLFSFSKGEEKEKLDVSNSILGMILLEKSNSLDIEGVIDELENTWNLKITTIETGEDASVLTIDGYHIAIGNISYPIPGNEVKETAEYNYLWSNAYKETKKHKGHIILSIVDAGKNPIKENILFNKLAASVLKNSKSIGLYIGGRTLLLKKDFYLTNTNSMSENNLPLYNWIYFGLRQENGKQSIYTYGLADFGKKEMEIINSTKNHLELIDMMYGIANYVLAYNVTLNDGETIGMSADQKLKISESKGKFLEGNTLKIEF
ncbi:DUF4261 domain-containing protein [Flammeovirga sp. EKP202]|nr:DUF4261 domain-containing protein [Flammeovirga sp. EKP202]